MIVAQRNRTRSNYHGIGSAGPGEIFKLLPSANSLVTMSKNGKTNNVSFNRCDIHSLSMFTSSHLQNNFTNFSS